MRYSTCCTLNSGSSDDTSFAKLTQNVQLFEKLNVKIAQIKTIRKHGKNLNEINYN